MRQAAVGKARNRILLVNHQGPPHQPGGDAAGACDESTQAHHHHRLVLPDDAEGLNQRPHEPERRCQGSDDALAANAADGQPLDRDALLRHHARLEASLSSEPHHFVGLRTQQTSQGERREDVSARAAGHDQNSRKSRGDVHSSPSSSSASSTGSARLAAAVVRLLFDAARSLPAPRPRTVTEPRLSNIAS